MECQIRIVGFQMDAKVLRSYFMRTGMPATKCILTITSEIIYLEQKIGSRYNRKEYRVFSSRDKMGLVERTSRKTVALKQKAIKRFYVMSIGYGTMMWAKSSSETSSCLPYLSIRGFNFFNVISPLLESARQPTL